MSTKRGKEYLHKWVIKHGTLDESEDTLKNTERGGIPSPPQSQKGMQRTESPSKRQRVDAAPADLTPTPSRNTSELAWRQPPSSAPSESSSRRAAIRRPPSPTKRYQLEALGKPVLYTALADNATGQLPPDVRGLYDRIYGITVQREGFLPHQIRAELCKEIGRDIPDSWFTKPKPGGDSTQQHADERSRAMRELYDIRDIIHQTHRCQERSKSEPACNVSIHGPVLSLALRPYDCLESESVTTARILAPFVPVAGSAAIPVEGKTVDFAIILDPANSAVEADKLLAKSIRDEVLSQPNDKQSVNHTSYSPLQFCPAPSLIETKAAGPAEEGRLQLAVSTAALHRRLDSFLDAKFASRSDERPLIATLLQMLVLDNEWKLYFACDRGDRVDMIGDMSIGDTKKIIECYILVAVLREIAKYISSVYKQWIADLFECRIPV